MKQSPDQQVTIHGIFREVCINLLLIIYHNNFYNHIAAVSITLEHNNKQT